MKSMQDGFSILLFAWALFRTDFVLLFSVTVTHGGFRTNLVGRHHANYFVAGKLLPIAGGILVGLISGTIDSMKISFLQPEL